ncbi:hypothetical protein LJR084_007679 [Variovorax sp. LjRoot84]
MSRTATLQALAAELKLGHLEKNFFRGTRTDIGARAVFTTLSRANP